MQSGFSSPYRFNLIYNRTRFSAGLGEGKFSESYLLYNFVKNDIKYPQVKNKILRPHRPNHLRLND